MSFPALMEKWSATYQDYRDLRQKIATAKSSGPDDERKGRSLCMRR